MRRSLFVKSRPSTSQNPLLLAELAREMAGAINDVVPPGLTVMASWVTEDPMVILVHDGVGIRGVTPSQAEMRALGGNTEDLSGYVEAALSEALSQFQDEIVESLGTPWPQTTESKGLPLNGTKLERDCLRGWYGAEDNPVLALRPILVPKSGS
jgi:hypothetical protein